MSVKRLSCPGCATSLNVPAAMANVKCPSCGTVWNVDNPAAAQFSAAAKATKQQEASPDEKKKDGNQMAVVGVLVGGAMVLLAIMAIGAIIISSTPSPAEVAASESVETIKPRIPLDFRVVDLPEDQRRRIYDDYRAVARTTVEKPLILPQGTKVRANFEDMLQKTLDRELTHFALLNNIEVEDVLEIIKEGDAKVWDDSVRSNAVRDGKRMYDPSMSQPKP